MKKLISLLLVLMMVLAVSACGSKTDESAAALPENATPAQKVIANFTAKASSGSNTSLEAHAEDMLQAEHIPFMGASMPVEPGYLNGFSAEITGFKAGQMFGPAIGSIPFIGYIFELEDASAANDFIATLKDNADLRWNICTQADEMAAGSSGNLVCFVMSPAAFED